MVTRIDNKIYDTHKAERVTEGLYRKRNGEYFTYEAGEIIPVNQEYAEEWCRSRDILAYDKMQHRKTSNIKKKVMLSLRESTVEELKREASSKKTSISDVVTKMVGNTK